MAHSIVRPFFLSIFVALAVLVPGNFSAHSELIPANLVESHRSYDAFLRKLYEVGQGNKLNRLALLSLEPVLRLRLPQYDRRECGPVRSYRR